MTKVENNVKNENLSCKTLPAISFLGLSVRIINYGKKLNLKKNPLMTAQNAIGETK